MSTKPPRVLCEAPDDLDPDLGIPIKDLNLVDAYFHELGIQAAEDRRPNTPEEQALDDALFARMKETMTKSPEQVRAERAARRRARR